MVKFLGSTTYLPESIVPRSFVDRSEGSFDTRDYGAVCNDSTNDYAAVQAAINACAAAGGGTVLQAGKSAIGSTLVIPNTTGNRVRLVGLGQDATQLRKTFNGLLLDWSGTATGYANHLHTGTIQDITLDGGGNTGTLLRTYYMDNMFANNVRFANNVGRGVDAVEFFDSKFSCCTWESVCGNSGLEPAFHMRSSIAASGFGSSTDNCNMIWFEGCRFEDFVDGGIWCERGGFGSANINGIYLSNMKFETHRVRGPAIRFDDSCKHMHASHIEIYMGAFMTGITTATDAIQNYTPGNSSIRDCRVTCAETAGTVANVVSTYCAAGPMTIDNLAHVGLAPTTAVINNFGGAGKFDYNAITTEGAPALMAGTKVPIANPVVTHNYNATGNLTVRTGKYPKYNFSGSTWSFISAVATVDSAPNGLGIVVSVLVDDVQAFTLTIPDGAKTSGVQSSLPGTVPSGSKVSIAITQVGSNVAGADLSVTMSSQSIT